MTPQQLTWPEFEHLIARFSNIGFYVRWTSSEFQDGCKGVYLMQTYPTQLQEFVDDLESKGFKHLGSDNVPQTPYTMHKFKSPKVVKK